MPRPQINLASDEYTSGSIVDGKYRLLRPLGEGGMGSVWAAHSSKLDVTVAMKLIRIDTANDDSGERLLREARVMARLADPGIVRIFDVGHTEHGQPFIVMELLVGATLRQVLDTTRVDAVRAVRLLLPIVRALECAHRAGVVHRDVKPDNIVLAQGARGDLQPKLLDFGAAKLVQGVDNLTRMGMVVGSPLYMSPEQARGEQVDHRTDLWSTCAVLYEAIVGDPPFQADNAHALLHAINTQEVRALPASHEFDYALWEIVSRGLTKKREDRWQTARDLMLELAAWLRAQGATEDITGTALQGRGLGSYSSVPAFAPDAEREAKHKSRALATAVMAAQGGARGEARPREAQPRGAQPRAAIASFAGAKPTGAFRSLLSGRHGSPRFWSAVGAALLVSLLIGIVLHRSSAVPTVSVRATPARAAPAKPGELPAPALPAARHPDDPDGDSAAASAAPRAPGPSAAARSAESAPAATKTQAAAPPAKRAAPAGSTPRKQTAATAPTKKSLARPTRATPFQNPFD